MGRRARIISAAVAFGLLALAPSAASPARPRGPRCGASPLVRRTAGAIRIRRGHRVVRHVRRLLRGDIVSVGRHGRVRVSTSAARILLGADTVVRMQCRRSARGGRALAVELLRGRVALAARRNGAVLLTPEALLRGGTRARLRLTRTARRRRTRIEVGRGTARVVRVRRPRVSLLARASQVALAGRRGLRLDVYPFPLPAADRGPTRRDALPAFWADGGPCSRSCRPTGARPGWPLRPFHRRHPLRAGLNELRPANLHVGFDIQARDGVGVYALQPGRAHIVKAAGVDERVQVGAFVYWHIRHRVREGQPVAPFRTVLGTVKPAFGHLHLSEVDGGGRYLNLLRPGGRVLAPWSDAERPVIGAPRVLRDGRAFVAAFDPQSSVARTTYPTPVIAPAALGWRLFDRAGRRVGPLHFALRGAQHLPDGLRRRVFAPGASSAGFTCFATRRLCRPNWRYVLAGGLTPRIPRGAVRRPHGLRLAVYAWDWAGNVTAREAPLRVTRSRRAAAGTSGRGSAGEPE